MSLGPDANYPRRICVEMCLRVLFLTYVVELELFLTYVVELDQFFCHNKNKDGLTALSGQPLGSLCLCARLRWLGALRVL